MDTEDVPSGGKTSARSGGNKSPEGKAILTVLCGERQRRTRARSWQGASAVISGGLRQEVTLSYKGKDGREFATWSGVQRGDCSRGRNRHRRRPRERGSGSPSVGPGLGERSVEREPGAQELHGWQRPSRWQEAAARCEQRHDAIRSALPEDASGRAGRRGGGCQCR